MALTHKVHPIYEVTFLWIDPFLSLIGFVGAFAMPQNLIVSWVPATVPNPATADGLPALPNPAAEHNGVYDVLVHELGGFCFVMLLLFGVLLRHTRDPFVWRLVLGGVGFVDFVILWSTALQYRAQGRLDPATWRWEDWSSVVVTAYVGVVRLAYVLGFGVGKKEKTN
ncbi:hypothetical protein HJFPF1_09489 [Paramyrothecium foliicola]|nr:hypothetical protein HJFPF1_09489 [Paramyrothecium foliicola]